MSGFFLGPRIAWGPGAIEQLSALDLRRPLLISDPRVAGREPARRVVEELEKSDGRVADERLLDGANRVDVLAEWIERWRPSPPDAVVAVGGGRTIDAAKAVRFSLTHPGISLDHLPPLLDPVPGPPMPLIAIPTTSGSGADASWTADLRSPDGTPLEIAERSLAPEWALVDPVFADSLPPESRLDGAFESLALATEAYLSAWANPFSDALALDAIGTVMGRLSHAVRWSEDPEARAALHYAATAAGLAASNAQRGLAHALARALEGPARLPYGRLLGIALPAVLDFDRPSARDRLEFLAARCRTEAEPAAVPFVQRVRRLADQLGFPATLPGSPDLGSDGARRRAADLVLATPAARANPRIPTGDEVGAILTAIGVA